MKLDDEGPIEVHASSGNIFADLDVSDAEAMLLKSRMVVELRRLIQVRKLTQTAAAKLVGMGQAELSKLLRGNLRGTSVERLMRMLTSFDQDVQIISRPHATEGAATISFATLT